MDIFETWHYILTSSKNTPQYPCGFTRIEALKSAIRCQSRVIELLSFIEEDMLSLFKYRDLIRSLEIIAGEIRRDLRLLNVQLPEEGVSVN